MAVRIIFIRDYLFSSCFYGTFPFSADEACGETPLCKKNEISIQGIALNV